MLDIKFIRENSSKVKENIKKKFQDHKLVLVDKVINLGEEWRAIKKEADKLRHERNSISDKINEEKKKGKDISFIIKRAKEIPERLKQIESQETSLGKQIKEILYQIPNIISKQTPIGKDASKNKVIKRAGKISKFSFPVKSHVELLEKNKLADFDSSAHTSGNGFYYLKGDLALLNQALIRFAIDFMKSKKYEYIEPPLMLNEKSIYASMDREAIKQSVYSIQDEDLNLIGTSEQALLAMHSVQAIPEEKLPKKYCNILM